MFRRITRAVGEEAAHVRRLAENEADYRHRQVEDNARIGADAVAEGARRGADAVGDSIRAARRDPSASASQRFIGPDSFIGQANIFESPIEKTDILTDAERRQLVYQFQNVLPKMPYARSVYTCKATFGENYSLEMLVMYSTEAEFDGKNPMLFYIPGTQSSMINPEIDIKFASHLRLAMKHSHPYSRDFNVGIVFHRLCPEVAWPIHLQDTIDIIKNYIQEKKPSKIWISGYSSGGMLAVFAALRLLVHEKHVEALLLFAPMLDITQEFRNIRPETSDHMRYLPAYFQTNIQKLIKSVRQSNRDSVLKDDGRVLARIARGMFRTKNRGDDPRALRDASVLWNINEIKAQPGFPKVITLFGSSDKFRPESEIFHEMLSEMPKSSTLVKIKGHDHKLFWNNLFPIYLACILSVKENAPPYITFTREMLRPIEECEKTINALRTGAHEKKKGDDSAPDYSDLCREISNKIPPGSAETEKQEAKPEPGASLSMTR